MSIFSGDEQLASVTHPTDSNVTKTSSYPATVSFTILMNIIKRNEDTIAVVGEDMGEYVSNVNGSYANAGSIRKGDKVACGTNEYIVINKPKYVRMFDKYKVLMNSNNGRD